MEHIHKMIPNVKEFSAAFAVEMIKYFGNGTKPQGNENVVNNENFWTIFMNGVKSAFLMHANNTESNANMNGTDLDEQVFAKFMHELNEMAKEINRSSDGSEDSIFINDSNDSPTLQSAFDILFNKFTPLIDHLSEKTVNELQHREFTQNEHANEPDDLKATNTQNTLSNIDETTSEMISTSTEAIIKDPDQKHECNRNITMEEFVQKLNEMKGMFGNAASDVFPLLGTISGTKTQNDDQNPELQKTHHMEITMVSLPNPLPSHRNTEIIALRIASNERLLVAVTSVTESTIKNNHDQIQVQNI